MLRCTQILPSLVAEVDMVAESSTLLYILPDLFSVRIATYMPHILRARLKTRPTCACLKSVDASYGLFMDFVQLGGRVLLTTAHARLEM